MDIYENIIIGNFLFGLGIEFGKRGYANGPTSLNASLLQQTPFDKKLGDVLLSNDVMFRILEFKRTAADPEKETAKLTILSRAFEDPATRHLLSISRDIHWYIETDTRTEALITRILPYLDLKTTVTAKSNTDLAMFVALTADCACASVPDAKYMKSCRDYLRLLTKLNAGKSSSSSGYLMVELSRSAQIRYVVVDNLRDLYLTQEQHLELVAEREQLRQQRSMGQEPQLEL